MPAYQYIYVMKGLGKTYPGGREVLRDIWLSFLPGAKIGVLGLNGAGKSTLLRDHGRRGARVRRRGLGGRGRPRSAICRRSRSSTRRKDVARQRHRGARRDQGAARPLRGGQRALRRGAVARGDGRADRRAGRAAGKDRPGRRLGDRPHGRDRDGRAALPAGRAAGERRCRAASGAASRCAGCLLQRPDLLAARRADQPSRRRIGRLAAALPRRITPAPSSPSPTTAISSTRSPAGSSSSTAATASRSRAIIRAGSSRSRRGSSRKARQEDGAPAHPGARTGMGAAEPAGAPGQEQGAALGL